MIPAQYVIIRYNPDPARNELLNLGVLLWHERDYRLRIDEATAHRVVQQNRHLHRDALLSLEPSLRKQLLAGQGFSDDLVGELLTRSKGFPLSFTEPRRTMLQGEQPQVLDETLERLVGRIVTPVRHYGDGRIESPLETLRVRLKPWVDRQAILLNHLFTESRSGVARRADFYANHGANRALDALKLALKKADDIQVRVDAEANKVFDVCAKNQIQYVVFCSFAEDERLTDATTAAQRILESAGATVVSSPDEAIDALTHAAA